MDGIRINKYMSQMGWYSRREADRLIDEGRVFAGGRRAEPGMKVQQGEEIAVDGKILDGEKPAPVIMAVYKPVGVVCTTDRRWKDPLLEDLIDYPGRVFSVGRLDKESEGLILMTNQGELGERILRGRNHCEKEYLVSVDRELREEDLEKMRGGVYLAELDRTTDPCRIQRTGKRSFSIVLTQGMNRQIRRMCACFQYRVLKLKRIRIMDIGLGELKSGQYRILGREETNRLLKGEKDR